MSETPNNTPAATPEALLAEVEALRAKNVQLLAELKAAKATATEATAAQDALQSERDAAVSDARALRLDGPVAALVADVAIDAELFRTLFDKHYRFALDDNGAVVILDSEGQPAMAKEPDRVRTSGRRGRSDYKEERIPGKTRPAAFTADDVRLLCDGTPDKERFERVLIGSLACGGGASSSPWRGGDMPTGGDKPASQAAPQPFGLR